MRDKVEDLAGATVSTGGSGTDFADARGSFRAEAIEALQALGYRPQDAEKMVKQIEVSHVDIDSASALIRKALQSSVQRP